MIVIADSNIFFGSLIAPSGELASILKDKNMQFMAPDYIIEEVKDHLDTIKKKRKKDKTNRQILADLALLLKNITVVPLEDLSDKNIQKAFSIVKDIDEDDYPFIAMHLQYRHKIWSRDEDLIEGLTQKGYGHFFISTDEVRKHLYKKKK